MHRRARQSNAGKGLVFETAETIRNSSVLGTAEDPVSDGLMSRILDVWMSKWKHDLEVLEKE